MAKNPSGFTFTHKEIAALLMKDADIHDGLWILGVTFTLAAANAGPDEGSMIPAAVVGVRSVELKKSDKPGPMIFDAAELNPA